MQQSFAYQVLTSSQKAKGAQVEAVKNEDLLGPEDEDRVCNEKQRANFIYFESCL
jgi:hypothetical protein